MYLKDIMRESSRSYEQMLFAYYQDAPWNCEALLREVLDDEEIEILRVLDYYPRVIAQGYIGAEAFAAVIMPLDEFDMHQIMQYESAAIQMLCRERSQDAMPIYLIVMTNDDPFGYGNAVYHLRTYIDELSIEVQDGIERILLNMNGLRPKKYHMFMQEILECAITDSMYLPPIHEIPC